MWWLLVSPPAWQGDDLIMDISIQLNLHETQPRLKISASSLQISGTAVTDDVSALKSRWHNTEACRQWLKRCHQGLSGGHLVSSGFRAISCTLLGLWVWSLLGPACYFQTFCLCSGWSWNQDAALGSSEEELYFEGTYYRNVESLCSAISRSFFYLIPPVFRQPWPKFSIPFPFILHHLSLKEKNQCSTSTSFFFFRVVLKALILQPPVTLAAHLQQKVLLA